MAFCLVSRILRCSCGLLVVFALVLLASSLTTLRAEENKPSEITPSTIESEATPWHFHITPHIWGTRLDGTLNLLGSSLPVSAPAADLAKNLEMGFMLNFDAMKGPWKFSLFSFFTRMGTKTDLILTELRTRTDLLIMKYMVGYNVFTIPLTSRKTALPRMRIGLAGGLRHTWMNLNASITSGAADVVDEHLFDFLAGTYVEFEFFRWLGLALEGSAGTGGGVGSAFAWQVGGILDFKVWKYLSIPVGYNVTAYEFNSDPSLLSLESFQLSGFLAGLTIRL